METISHSPNQTSCSFKSTFHLCPISLLILTSSKSSLPQPNVSLLSESREFFLILQGLKYTQINLYPLSHLKIPRTNQGTHLEPILGITHLKLEATSHFPQECLVASCFPVCLPLILFSSCSFIYVKTSSVFRTMRVHRATYKRIT